MSTGYIPQLCLRSEAPFKVAVAPYLLVCPISDVELPEPVAVSFDLVLTVVDVDCGLSKWDYSYQVNIGVHCLHIICHS
jgi:hypothetical protein